MGCSIEISRDPLRVEYRYILHPRYEYFARPKAEGNIPTEGAIYAGISQGSVEYLVYYIEPRKTAKADSIRSDVPIEHAQYQGWNIGVEYR